MPDERDADPDSAQAVREKLMSQQGSAPPAQAMQATYRAMKDALNLAPARSLYIAHPGPDRQGSFKALLSANGTVPNNPNDYQQRNPVKK